MAQNKNYQFSEMQNEIKKLKKQLNEKDQIINKQASELSRF